jgi:PIN domain nuclease of toxin-antitoxin system
MEYLIDTNIFLWFVFDDPRLPEYIRNILKDERNVIKLSIVSLIEITIKVSMGKLLPNIDLNDFFQKRVFDRGLNVLSIEINHLLTLRSLPFHHKAPFDRLIVAQSLTEHLELLYTDDAFLPYYS